MPGSRPTRRRRRLEKTGPLDLLASWRLGVKQIHAASCADFMMPEEGNASRQAAKTRGLQSHGRPSRGSCPSATMACWHAVCRHSPACRSRASVLLTRGFGSSNGHGRSPKRKRRCWVETSIGEPLQRNLSLERRRPETALSWKTFKACRQAGPASMLRVTERRRRCVTRARRTTGVPGSTRRRRCGCVRREGWRGVCGASRQATGTWG